MLLEMSISSNLGPERRESGTRRATAVLKDLSLDKMCVYVRSLCTQGLKNERAYYEALFTHLVNHYHNGIWLRWVLVLLNIQELKSLPVQNKQCLGTAKEATEQECNLLGLVNLSI